MTEKFEEIKDQFIEAAKVLVVGGATWVNEVMVLERDPIAEFTNGKQSLVRKAQNSKCSFFFNQENDIILISSQKHLL